MYKYNTSKLKNGLSILSIPNNKTKLITLDINLKLGNDSEIISKHLEITHFLEHMFCLFTSSKYPDGKTNREILYNKNIELDASVIDKNLNFSLEFKPVHSSMVLDFIINALLDFKPDKNIFKQEKNAVIEELNNIIKDSDYLFETKINSLIFKGHQRSISIKDRLENCKKITTKQIYDFYKTYFTPKNMTITIFGHFSSDFISTIKKNLSTLKGKEIIYYPLTKFHNEKIIYYHKKSNISNIRILFNIPVIYFDKINYQIDALLSILSSDLNSILLKKLRTDYGLIYSLSMNNDCDEVDKYLSYIIIDTLCDTKNLILVIKKIFETLIDVKNIKIPDSYIKKFIELENITHDKEKFSPDPDSVLSDYTHSLLWGKKIVSFEDNHTKSKNISSISLKKTANMIFDFSKITVCYDGQQNLNKQLKELLQYNS